jgi:hypothetical protein
MFHRVDTAGLRVAEEFEALDVAPVAPFGACAALSGIDQNNVLTALRRAEVLADPTIALALAVAVAVAVAVAERRRDPAARHRVVRLCTSARLVRMQVAGGVGAGHLPNMSRTEGGVAARMALGQRARDASRAPRPPLAVIEARRRRS